MAQKSAAAYLGAILLTDGTLPSDSDQPMLSDLAQVAAKYQWSINEWNGALSGYYARIDQEKSRARAGAK